MQPKNQNPNQPNDPNQNPDRRPEPRKDFPGKAPDVYAEDEPGNARDPSRGRDRPAQPDPQRREQSKAGEGRDDRDPSRNEPAGGRNPNQSGNRN